MATDVRSHRSPERATHEPARRAGRGVALWGLATRGALYILLAIVTLEVALGHRGQQADTRGALHELANHSLGRVLLWLLAVGFAGFAVWHAYEAFSGDHHAQRADAGRRLADAARALVYGVLCWVAISFVTSSHTNQSSDRTDRTWTAKVLGWSNGALLVGAAGAAVIVVGLYLVWRAFSDERQDEPSVLEAAPHESPTIRLLARVGNVARGTVVVLLGVFLVAAAVEHNPNKSAGLDDALKRLLGHSYGPPLVVIVALGFAAFGVYSIARAWANRREVTRA